MFPVIITVSITYSKSYNIISEKIQESINNNIDQVKLSIDDLLESSKSVLNVFILDNDLKKQLNKHMELDTPEGYETTKMIMDLLNNLVKSSGKIDSIFIYDINDNILITSSGTAFEDSDFFSSHIYVESAGKGRIGEWIINSHDIVAPYSVENVNYVTYVMPIIIYEERMTVGYVYININEKTIYNYMEKITLNGSGSMMIANDKGEIISCGDKNMLGKNQTPDYYYECINQFKNNGEFPIKIDKGNTLVFMKPSVHSDMYYIALVPISNINKEIQNLLRIVTVVCLLTMFIALFISRFFMKSIYTPIKRMVTAMDKLVFKPDLDYYIEEKRKDEFGILYNSFNGMVDGIKKLFEQLFAEKLKKKEAQLKFLQAQMNPHFLYNTLNSIYYISKLHGINEITELSYSLTNFFRLSLSGGLELITVREMLDHIGYYIKIQNIRYKDQFELITDVDPELLEHKVLKFMLQPLVENSILHGMKNKEEKGVIEVAGYIVNDIIKFTVKDNGVGIPQDEFEKIQSTLSQPLDDEEVETSEMFALRNIHKRIRLHYGEQYGLRVFTTEGEGTVVEVVLPYIKEGDDNV